MRHHRLGIHLLNDRLITVKQDLNHELADLHNLLVVLAAIHGLRVGLIEDRFLFFGERHCASAKDIEIEDRTNRCLRALR